MGATILKQNQGNKILRQNQGGKILKANYNFGKSFVGTTANGAWTTSFSSTPAIYLTVPDLIGQSMGDFSIMAWGKCGSSFNEGFFEIETDTNFFVSAAGSGFNSQIIVNNSALLGIPSDPSVIEPVLHGYRSGRGFKNDFNNSISEVVAPSGNYTLFRIGIGRYSYGRPDRLYPGTVGELIVFNRSFTDQEYNYYYNKGLGNEPLFYSGVKLHYKMKKAEILTIGGVDDVGIRNEAQDAFHAKINGLPAGTLEEKVAWANANMFVNFL